MGTVPDHGKTEFDPNWFHGGYYATPHIVYYKNTVFKNLRAPEFGDYDMLAAVIPEAKKRGMKVYGMMADNFRKHLPNAEMLLQVNLQNDVRAISQIFYTFEDSVILKRWREQLNEQDFILARSQPLDVLLEGN